MLSTASATCSEALAGDAPRANTANSSCSSVAPSASRPSTSTVWTLVAVTDSPSTVSTDNSFASQAPPEHAGWGRDRVTFLYRIAAGNANRPSVLVSDRPPGYQRRIDADRAGAGRAAGRSQWGVASGQDLGEEGRVVGQVLLLFLRQIGLEKNRVHLADERTGRAVHAFVGVDVQRAGAFIDAVRRAVLHTRFVHHVDTRRTDHIC